MAKKDIPPGLKFEKELPGFGSVEMRQRLRMVVGLKANSPIWEQMEKQLFSDMKKG